MMNIERDVCGYGESPFVGLNLDPIMAKLCHREKGAAWELDRARAAAEQYRRWLWLFSQNPGEHFSPSPDIDNVWHMHILDTRKYADDCAVLFGHLLHHNPYSGWESDEAEHEHQLNYIRTCEMYFAYFGESMEGALGICDGGCYGKDILPEDIWRPRIPLAA